jgi:ABC-type glycerol-3-phosphate transport system substrate-binding protein
MAADKGLIDFTKSPYKDVYEIIKGWEPYWNKDYNAVNKTDALNMFLRGKVAMGMFGSWELKTIENMEGRDFDYGAFPIPAITKETNTHASGKSFMLGGGPSGVYAVSGQSEEAKREAAVDLLRYLTSPEAAQMLAEGLYSISSLVGAELGPELAGFELAENELPVGNGVDFLSARLSTEFDEFEHRAGQLYLQGEVTLDEYMQEMNKEYRVAIEQLMETNAWNKDNEYGNKK